MEENVGMPEKKYVFISADKLNCVYDLHEIQGNLDKIYHHFLENDDEVLYITENGRMYGLISIGDMFRYYKQEPKTREVPINQKFSYVEGADDYVEADVFFDRSRFIHEIPVIKERRLLGVIRNYFRTSKESSREELKYRLILYKNRYRIDKLKLFAEQGHTVLICKRDPSDMVKFVVNHFTEAERKVLRQRQSYGQSKEYRAMTKEERRCYLEKFLRDNGIMQFARPILDRADLKSLQKNGIYRYGECHDETFHCADGRRRTPNVPENAGRKIWLLGPCIIFGCYVKDTETIGYYLQKHLLEHSFNHYEVVNCGMRDSLEVLFTEPISVNDIVVIYDGDWGRENNAFDGMENIHCIWDFTEIYMKNLNLLMRHIFDWPHHCDAYINEQIAEKMYEGILPFLSKDVGDAVPGKVLQDYYISSQVFAYYELFGIKHRLRKEPDKRTGAIVMNCNPYTYGHRYLIEQACEQVDRLYVFVVEEDKSYFKFTDRLEMVKRGTADLKKVQVLPSGKYIISQDTFAQYFAKDQVINEIDDMDYDIRIFGEVVADVFGISCRFVGEEPFDKVTKKYNETMQRILPEYQVDVVEIPRKELEGKVISASMVRKYLEQGALDKICELVPESTVDVCKKYM